MVQITDESVKWVLGNPAAEACWHRAMAELKLFAILTKCPDFDPVKQFTRYYEAAERKALELTYEPCRKCGRQVKTPCHDWDGLNEGGPWDFACADLFRS